MVVLSVLPRSILVAVTDRFLSRRAVVLEVTEECVELLEALLPVRAVLADPLGDVAERLRAQAARPPLRLPSLLDQPGSLEHPQVLGDRRLAQVERRGELGDRCLAAGEAGQDGAPGWIGQGREDRAEWILLSVHFSLVI